MWTVLSHLLSLTASFRWHLLHYMESSGMSTHSGDPPAREVRNEKTSEAKSQGHILHIPLPDPITALLNSSSAAFFISKQLPPPTPPICTVVPSSEKQGLLRWVPQSNFITVIDCIRNKTSCVFSDSSDTTVCGAIELDKIRLYLMPELTKQNFSSSFMRSSRS